MAPRCFLSLVVCTLAVMLVWAINSQACTSPPGYRSAVVRTPQASYYVSYGALFIKERSGLTYTSCHARFPAYAHDSISNFSRRPGVLLHAIQGPNALHRYSLAIVDNDVFAIEHRTATVLLLSPTGYSILWSPPGDPSQYFYHEQNDSVVTFYHPKRVVRYHLGKRTCLNDLRISWIGFDSTSPVFLEVDGNEIICSVPDSFYQQDDVGTGTYEVFNLDSLPRSGFVHVVHPSRKSTISVHCTKERRYIFSPSHPFHLTIDSATRLLRHEVQGEISYVCYGCNVWSLDSPKTEFFDMVADANGNVFISSSKGIYIIPATHTDEAKNAVLATTTLEAGVIYPNPATTHFTCNMDASNLIQPSATLIDLGGRAYATKPIEGATTTFDVSMLPTGTYGLVLSTTNAKVFRTVHITR